MCGSAGMPSGHLNSLCLLLERAAGGPVESHVGGREPSIAAVRAGDDDAIISGMP